MALAFHKEAFAQILEEDALLIMARGLGLHKIFINFVKLYCSEANSKQLVFIINVTPFEQQCIIEELLEAGLSNYQLPKRINAEYTAQERINLYMEGGVHFLASPSLVMDMLYKRVPPHLIHGIMIHHCEEITETCVETFILRLFRQNNKTGFIKGFSEYPESFGKGFCKVEKVMKNIFVKKLFLWPRFRDIVNDSLSRHRPDVVELHQPMTPAMEKIQAAILEIMGACLDELKKSNMLDISEITVEDGWFREFDIMVRSQLEPIWHKVGIKTKQLVSDLQILRKLLNYLLEYDCVSFYRYLEVVRKTELNQESVWVFMEAADTLFRVSKSRVFVPKRGKQGSGPSPTKKLKTVKDENQKGESESKNKTENETKDESNKDEEKKEEKAFLNPKLNEESNFQPVLEENPKWKLLREVLKEIENEEIKGKTGLPGKVLVMVKDERTCTQIQEMLEVGERIMLERRFLRYLESKTSAPQPQTAPKPVPNGPYRKGRGRGSGGGNAPNQNAGRGKGKQPVGRGKSTKQKTSPAQPRITDYSIMLQSLLSKPGVSTSKPPISVNINQNEPPTSTSIDLDEFPIKESKMEEENSLQKKKEAEVVDLTFPDEEANSDTPDINVLNSDIAKKQKDKERKRMPQGLEDFDEYFGVLPAPHIIIHPFAARKRVLEELRPKFVVMYDPDIAFFRQLEVYKAENPGVPLRVYWLWYSDSIEEKRYLAGLQKEDKSFKDLIHEKAIMSVSADQDGKTVIDLPEETISSTRKGGKFTHIKKGNKVIVDSREFRSALPSILHQREMEILPATLEVGDYIVTPEIAVERKSISDLYSSFTSGRLYNQSTNMCKHFKKPALLIEFSEDKPFGFNPDELTQEINPMNIISKLVLLTIHFPTLRLLWSRSPFVTAKLFEELKQNTEDPDLNKVSIVDGDGQSDSAEVLLRTLPGITSFNYKQVMQKVKNLHELSQMSQSQMVEILGSKNGKSLYEFFNSNLARADST